MSIWKTKKENPIIEKEGLYLTFSKEMGTRLLYFQKDKKLYLMCIDEYCLLDDLLNQQTEIKRLRDLLKQCIPAAEFAKDKGLADMINKALNGESEKQ